MHADTEYLATPETLDELADQLASGGAELSSKAIRTMAVSWRATQRQLHETQAENSRLASTLATAHQNATRLEALAAATANVLASIGAPRPLTETPNVNVVGS